jgi:UDP-N-acetylglucosamine:LPS N-acetylglucosamine transferase
MMKVLIAASAAAPAEVVRPVTAALQAVDADVSTVDLGRIGDTSSRLGRVVKAFIGEAEATRLVRELTARRPDVALAFDPGAAAALVLARDRRVSETAVVAVVPGFAVDKTWAVAADRFAAIDDEVAVALADLGVDGARVITVGPIVARAIHDAAGLRRADVRAEYKMPDLPVVLVDAREMPDDMLQSVALQLSLTAEPIYIMFDAAGSASAAGWLRRNVPTLGIKGKLFGDTPNAAKLWRSADVVVGRPSARAMLQARALGAAFVGVEPRSAGETAELAALAERGFGAGSNALLIAAALGPFLRRRGHERAGDGASGVADLVVGVAAHKAEVLAESAAIATEAEPAPPAGAGEPEDIDGFGDDAPVDPRAHKMAADLDAAEARARRELDDSRAEAERWDERRKMAEARGDTRLAADAAREADRKRARMHEALERLQRIGRERAAVKRPPPPRPSEDDLLASFKEKVRGRAEARSVDDELAALKQKMRDKKKP